MSIYDWNDTEIPDLTDPPPWDPPAPDTPDLPSDPTGGVDGGDPGTDQGNGTPTSGGIADILKKALVSLSGDSNSEKVGLANLLGVGGSLLDAYGKAQTGITNAELMGKQADIYGRQLADVGSQLTDQQAQYKVKADLLESDLALKQQQTDIFTDSTTRLGMVADSNIDEQVRAAQRQAILKGQQADAAVTAIGRGMELTSASITNQIGGITAGLAISQQQTDNAIATTLASSGQQMRQMDISKEQIAADVATSAAQTNSAIGALRRIMGINDATLVGNLQQVYSELGIKDRSIANDVATITASAAIDRAGFDNEIGAVNALATYQEKTRARSLEKSLSAQRALYGAHGARLGGSSEAVLGDIAEQGALDIGAIEAKRQSDVAGLELKGEQSRVREQGALTAKGLEAEQAAVTATGQERNLINQNAIQHNQTDAAIADRQIAQAGKETQAALQTEKIGSQQQQLQIETAGKVNELGLAQAQRRNQAETQIEGLQIQDQQQRNDAEAKVQQIKLGKQLDQVQMEARTKELTSQQQSQFIQRQAAILDKQDQLRAAQSTVILQKSGIAIDLDMLKVSAETKAMVLKNQIEQAQLRQAAYRQQATVGALASGAMSMKGGALVDVAAGFWSNIKDLIKA